MSVGLIDILMKNVELEWKIPRDVRDACLDSLKCLNEAAVNRLQLFHALAVTEAGGEGFFDLDAAREICPDYPGLVGILPTVLHLLEENFPHVVWYSLDGEGAQTEAPPFEDCKMCEGEEWEEAILCPQCYGSGKTQIQNHHPVRTLDVFISQNVSRKIL
jgi:hypothetical protein